MAPRIFGIHLVLETSGLRFFFIFVTTRGSKEPPIFLKTMSVKRLRFDALCTDLCATPIAPDSSVVQIRGREFQYRDCQV